MNSPQELLLKIQQQIGTNVLTSVPEENEEYYNQVKEKANNLNISLNDLSGGVQFVI